MADKPKGAFFRSGPGISDDPVGGWGPELKGMYMDPKQSYDDHSRRALQDLLTGAGAFGAWSAAGHPGMGVATAVPSGVSALWNMGNAKAASRQMRGEHPTQQYQKEVLELLRSIGAAE